MHGITFIYCLQECTGALTITELVIAPKGRMLIVVVDAECPPGDVNMHGVVGVI